MSTTMQSGFETMLRGLTPDAREEAAAEAIALAWQNYASLAAKGQEAKATVHTLAWYAAKAVRRGQSVGTSASRNDVLHMTVANRVQGGVLLAGDIDIATVESRKATPADLAAFRLDFAEFFRRLNRRQRGIAQRLAAGFTTGEVARIYDISPAAISQNRRALEALWLEFQGL